MHGKEVFLNKNGCSSMVDISEIAINLKCGQDGIWFAKTQSRISYPENGNAWCFQVEEDSFWFNHRKNCILEAIRVFPPDGAFLDIGGGNGYMSLAIKDIGIDTILVEPGIEGATNARKRGLPQVICATLEDSGFKTNSIGAIGLFDILEHIEDDEGFLKTINGLMAANGRVYITVPAYNFLFSFEDKRSKHYRRYTNTSLVKKLESAGFGIDFKTYIFSLLPIPIFFVRTVPSAIGLRKKSEFRRILKEHRQPIRGFNRLLMKVFDREILALKNKKKIPFGASCLIVARASE
jgi:SAM-dependent methyltransferase